MRYQAKPVLVDAFVIAKVGPLADQGGNFRTLTLEDGKLVLADSGMLARYTPEAGDYWVVQEDGYVYVNPKSVFERKYGPVEPNALELGAAARRAGIAG